MDGEKRKCEAVKNVMLMITDVCLWHLSFIAQNVLLIFQMVYDCSFEQASFCQKKSLHIYQACVCLLARQMYCSVGDVPIYSCTHTDTYLWRHLPTHIGPELPRPFRITHLPPCPTFRAAHAMTEGVCGCDRYSLSVRVATTCSDISRLCSVGLVIPLVPPHSSTCG